MNRSAHRLTGRFRKLLWIEIRLARVLIPALVAVLYSVATPHALAADPYVVYTANQQVDGAVILRSEPATGSTVEISRNGPQGNLFRRPYDLAVEPSGSLVVADMGVPNQKDGALLRVDPVTGRQSVVSSGGLFFDPAGIAVGPGGSLYVLDNFDGIDSGAVIKVDPRTGAQTLISANVILPRLFDFPFGIAVDRNGQIVVVNRSRGGALPVPCLVGTGSIFRVDPHDGSQTPISSLGRLAYPLGVAVAGDGSLAVANECGGVSADGVVRIRPDGAQEHITTNNTDDVLQTPERVAFDPAGGLLVTDYAVGADGDGGLVRVNPATGAQSVVTTDSLFNHPLGIAVVRNRPPTASLSVSPPTVKAGSRVTLDASGSRDPEGLRLVYEWDLDGNGTFEAGSGTTPSAMPTFSVNGPHAVRVRVNDPHGGRAVAEGIVNVDGRRPVVSDVRASAKVLGLRHKRGGGKAGPKRKPPPTSTSLRFKLSEAAMVTASVRRARAGRRAEGACSTRSKRGRPCTAWSVSRQIKRSQRAGRNRLTLRSRGLRPGRYRIVLRATDAVGNRSQQRSIGLRVVRLPR